ncbi:MAG: hypothetical protein GQ569_09975, partial [Methylococcaceae bacterium]|nr:hypothetical protein [Methylococcaceae bacterium]
KVDITLNSKIQKLTGLAEPVRSLLGQTLSLNADIEIKPESSVLVKKLQLNAKAVSMNAKTQLNLKNQQLKGKLNLAIPQLATKDLKLQQAKAQINISGTITNPDIEAVINLAKLEAAEQKFKALKLKLTAKDVIDNLRGALQLSLKQHGQPLTLNTNYALKKQQLNLDKLSLNAPKTKLKGQISINLTTALAQGKLVANSDLSALKPWTGQALNGQLNLSADFKPLKQQQYLQLKTQLNQFKIAELKIKSIELEAQIEHALKNPHINANLKLQQLTQQQTLLEKLNLNAKGLLSNLTLILDIKGKHQQAFALNSVGILKHSDKQTQFQLQKLAGTAAKQKLKLNDTSTVTLAGKNITLSPFALSIGSANLQAQLDYSLQKILGEVKLDLPLTFVNQFVEIPVKGDVNALINLAGTAKQPEINLAVNLKDLKSKAFDFKKFPATQIQLKATLKQQHLNADVNINNPQFKRAIQLQVQSPVTLQLEPFTFVLPEEQSLKGQLIAALDLAQTTKNLPLKGQQIKGDFNINLNLAGSIKQPQLQGNINLKNGEYQNSLTETFFKAIHLNIDAKPNQIRLTDLSLKDNEAGDLKAKAFLTLDESAHYPMSAEIDFNHLQLANSPDLKTHLSGGLKLKGDSQNALLSGLLNIDDFNLTLPSMSDQEDIPEMEVIEIGGDRASAKEQLKQKKANAKKALNLKLDVGVKIAKQFYIKGYGLDSEWQGDLSIKGVATMPKVLGKIQTKRGSLEVLNNRFVFRQGIIDFNGAYPPLPSLNIETVTETDTGEAAIRISGMADNPQLKLAHTPDLPQDEILSSLLFGQDVKSISPMQALQLTDVIGIIATGGLASMGTLGSVQSGLGLDRLNIGGDDFDTASVKAGKYITDKIYLEVEQGLQSESSTATVEIDLLPDIKAEIEFNQESDSSVGIKWKHDY